MRVRHTQAAVLMTLTLILGGLVTLRAHHG